MAMRSLVVCVITSGSLFALLKSPVIKVSLLREVQGVFEHHFHHHIEINFGSYFDVLLDNSENDIVAATVMCCLITVKSCLSIGLSHAIPVSLQHFTTVYTTSVERHM